MFVDFVVANIIPFSLSSFTEDGCVPHISHTSHFIYWFVQQVSAQFGVFSCIVWCNYFCIIRASILAQSFLKVVLLLTERPDLKTHKSIASWKFWYYIRHFILYLCVMAPFCALYDYFFIESVIENPLKFGFMCVMLFVIAGFWFPCLVVDALNYSVAEIVVASKYRSDLSNSKTIDMNASYGHAYILTQGGETFMVDDFVFDKLNEFEFYYVVYIKEGFGFWKHPYKQIVKILDLHKNSLEV